MQVLLYIPDEDIPEKHGCIDVSLIVCFGEIIQCTYPYDILPKGHGNLIDKEYLLMEMVGITDGWMCPRKDWNWYEDSVKAAHVIIKADRAESEV